MCCVSDITNNKKEVSKENKRVRFQLIDDIVSKSLDECLENARKLKGEMMSLKSLVQGQRIEMPSTRKQKPRT